MGLMGGSNSGMAAKMLTFSLAVMLLLPLFLTVFVPASYTGSADEVLDGYTRMTGQSANTKVSVWPLTGIYTPFTGQSLDDSGKTLTYGQTDDGWIYGSRVQIYTPSQYVGTSQQYTVYRDDAGLYRYYADSADYNADAGTGHHGREIDDSGNVTYAGDLYNAVTFDVLQKSDVFFTEAGRTDYDSGAFKYDYTGYRMAFQPISNYVAENADGQRVPIIATTTSLSLVWYQYASQSGITGQLVLSGSSGGVAYINAAQILAAFNSVTYTAPFDMVFNGVKMTIYIQMDPIYLSSGWTVQDCYNAGYWSILVTSQSVDSSAYTGTDNVLNPTAILETMIDLLTFRLDDYNFSPLIQSICYILYIAPLYVGLIVLCLDNAYLWILVGALAAIQALGSWWPF